MFGITVSCKVFELLKVKFLGSRTFSSKIYIKNYLLFDNHIYKVHFGTLIMKLKGKPLYYHLLHRVRVTAMLKDNEQLAQLKSSNGKWLD